MNNRQIVLEPTTQSFVDVMASRVGKPIYELSYADARQAAEDLQTWTKVNKLPADVEERILPVSPTGQISVTIYRPKGSTETLPVVMYFHGGGWVLCSKNTHDRLLRDLVNGTNAAFVFVNYTASPEAQFPIPVEQCLRPRNTSPNMAASLVSIPHGLQSRVTAPGAIWRPLSRNSPKNAKVLQSVIKCFSIQ